MGITSYINTVILKPYFFFLVFTFVKYMYLLLVQIIYFQCDLAFSGQDFCRLKAKYVIGFV